MIKEYLNGQGFFNDAYELEVAIVDKDNVFQYMEKRSMPVGTKPPEPFILDNPAEQLKTLEAGQVLQRQTDKKKVEKWVAVADFRGQEFYKKSTGEPVTIDYVGAISSDLTDSPCPDAGLYDFEENKKTGLGSWVLNPSKSQAAIVAKNADTKAKLSAYAAEQVNVLQDAVNFGIATPEEAALLDKWKAYRFLLWRIDETDQVINWPEVPEK